MAVQRKSRGGIGVVVAGLAILALLVTIVVRWLKQLRVRADEELALVRMRFTEATAGSTPLHLNPALWADLPPFARRYLRHTVGEAHRVPRGVHLTVRGAFRPDPSKDDWWPMSAEQWIAPELGFLWQATVRKGPVTIKAADWFMDGEGRMDVLLMGLIPVLRKQGDPDIDRSSLGRMLIESIMTPWIWLPSHGARWTTRKDRRVELTTPGFDHKPLLLSIAADGRLQRAELPRWGDEKGVFSERTFFVNVRDEMDADGWTLPAVIEAGWVDEDGVDQAFYKADMEVV